jgi:hypothetical protein
MAISRNGISSALGAENYVQFVVDQSACAPHQSWANGVRFRPRAHSCDLRIGVRALHSGQYLPVANAGFAVSH